MDLKRQTEIFINVHKGLRRGLWGLALHIGELDWSDEKAVEAAGHELERMVHFLRAHAASEDEVQFPFLESRVPGTTQQEQDEHRELESRLDLIEKHWYQLLRGADREILGYRFYLEYNQFVARYLDHMDREERHLTEAFYRYCSEREIEDTFKQVVARTTPQSMDLMLSYMIPAMSPADRGRFMARTKAAAPPETLDRLESATTEVIAPQHWREPSTGDDDRASRRTR